MWAVCFLIPSKNSFFNSYIVMRSTNLQSCKFELFPNAPSRKHILRFFCRHLRRFLLPICRQHLRAPSSRLFRRKSSTTSSTIPLLPYSSTRVLPKIRKPKRVPGSRNSRQLIKELHFDYKDNLFCHSRVHRITSKLKKNIFLKGSKS